MGRSSRPKKSPTIPSMPTFDPSTGYPRSPVSPSFSSFGGNSLGSNGKPLYLCQPFVGASLVKGSLKTISSVPKYVDPKEWVAVNRMYLPPLLSRAARVALSLTHGCC